MALTPARETVARQILLHLDKANAWLKDQSQKTPPPFYSSIDIRDADFKIAPVDCNLYPAGFNNICPDDLEPASKIFREQILKTPISQHQKVLILPESHTSNGFYLENIRYLTQLIANAGFEVQIGWYDPTQTNTDPVSLRTSTEHELTAFPIRVEEGVLKSGFGEHLFVPDLIILNNDFSSGYPVLLDTVEQPILPRHDFGWHSRRKETHFRHYNLIAQEFSEIIEIDPWLIQVDTQAIDDVNFGEAKGIEQVAHQVDKTLLQIQSQYRQRDLVQDPFVFVKSNSGTYGMGIMAVQSGDEVRAINRRTKNKMSIGKNRSLIDSVVVQEGVPTAAEIEGIVSEPAIYLVGCELIGGFLRTNSTRSATENLNSKGMAFRKLCVSDLKTLSNPSQISSQQQTPETDPPKRILELAYGGVARLSALAAGREIAEL